MVFIHGESFEWNSGNPYDGSVLAAYGKVIVITLNFRLGILGFLKSGTEEGSHGNFGLVDQVAALMWIRDNIGAFGGDPNSVTVFGQGTGAVCTSLLMISPMILNGERRLFDRAILMSGTALSDWGLAGNPSEVTFDVANALNCQIRDKFEDCLRKKSLDDIMAATTINQDYQTRFGPIVDSMIIPNDPKKSMTEYHDLFRRYELMYGVTQIESMDLLGPVAVTQGMLERERDQELRKYLRYRCEIKPELCLMYTLAHYQKKDFVARESEYTGHEPDKASMARDAVLDILSDARTVAPVVQMGKFHSALNLQSYLYVFTHKSHSKEYIRNMSYNGEELPYVFGIPLGGPKFHYVDSYTEQEKLFSEVIMTYFSNFAHTGNPNVPSKDLYQSMNPLYWSQFDNEWLEFDSDEERYMELDIPTRMRQHYRYKEMKYWNEEFPKLSQAPYNYPQSIPTQRTPTIVYMPSKANSTRKGPPSWLIPERTRVVAAKPTQEIFGTKVYFGSQRPDNMVENVYGTILESPPKEVRQSSTMNIITIIGGVFLMVNLILFTLLYFKCYRNKKSNNTKVDETETNDGEKRQMDEEAFLLNGCNIVSMMSKSSKSEDTYEAVRGETPGYKLSRQISGSTIDAHTKVRDWIAQEIIYKYSPRFFRKTQDNKKTKVTIGEENPITAEVDGLSTLGRSPTRPVSPAENNIVKPIMKTSTITRPKIKPGKVSVGIDATPSGRGPSVLMQQPIELTKSLDYPNIKPTVDMPLRRSLTLEDFSPRIVDKKEIRKSTTSINLEIPQIEPTIIKIDHKHSRSDPVQDVNYSEIKKMKTFDPNADVNVTSRDDNQSSHIPLTPEEALQTIKRRNFPKVLPDHPGREALMIKRRSMPAPGFFIPIPEISTFSQSNSPLTKSVSKLPPAPPPRTTTLVRQGSTKHTFISEPTLVEEPNEEPELVCNNLYVGPIVPRHKQDTSKMTHLNTQPIYDSLKNLKANESGNDSSTNKPKAIIVANSNVSVKRADPKVVVRPTLSKKPSDDKITKHIPRVMSPDNQPHLVRQTSIDELPGKTETSEKEKVENSESSNSKLQRPVKTSHIPKLVKTSNPSLNKESSSSDSTPSEESDTGTVVKKI